jgi:hypothetical protein
VSSTAIAESGNKRGSSELACGPMELVELLLYPQGAVHQVNSDIAVTPLRTTFISGRPRSRYTQV